MIAALALATTLHFAGQTDHSDIIPLEVGHTSVSIDVQHISHVSFEWATAGTGAWIAHAVDRPAWALTTPSGMVIDGRRSQAPWADAGPLGASGIFTPDLPTSGGATISPVPAFLTLRTTARTSGGSATIGIGTVLLIFHTTYTADVTLVYH